MGDRYAGVKPKTTKENGTENSLGFNGILYRLCEEHPGHTNEDEIVAKIWLVGRSYSAAIERRRASRDVSGEAFYTTTVVDSGNTQGTLFVGIWFWYPDSANRFGSVAYFQGVG